VPLVCLGGWDVVGGDLPKAATPAEAVATALTAGQAE
jgi:hypothetical protein